MRARELGAIVILAVALVGCGSSAPATTAGSIPTDAASTAAVTPPAGEPSDVATAPTPAGGGATGVCELVTADDLATILGGPITTRVLAGPPDTCDIQSNGAPVAAFVLTPSGGGFVFDAYAGDAGATSISGMGDKAAYNPTQQLLVILKGDSLLSIAAFAPEKTPEERLELMKQIGALAAGRM